MTGQTGGGTAEAPILVVEDDPQLRRMICWALEDEGFVVEAAGDGRQAVERTARVRPSLVVLDMTLPVLDGVGVARELRAIYSEPPPVLVMTADGRAAEKARRVGAYAYLTKPFDVDELVTLVRQGLGSS